MSSYHSLCIRALKFSLILSYSKRVPFRCTLWAYLPRMLFLRSGFPKWRLRFVFLDSHFALVSEAFKSGFPRFFIARILQMVSLEFCYTACPIRFMCAGSGVGTLRSEGQIRPTACSCKYSFIEAQPRHSFICVCGRFYTEMAESSSEDRACTETKCTPMLDQHGCLLPAVFLSP